MDSTVIIASIVVFLVVVFLLVGMLLGVKAKLLPSGPVSLLINGEKNVEVSSGSTLLSTLGNNKIFLPKIGPKDKPLHLGFFYTGAYQESLSGYGGLKHCLIPAPKHIIITKPDEDDQEEYVTKLFSKEQSAKSMMKILGY